MKAVCVGGWGAGNGSALEGLDHGGGEQGRATQRDSDLAPKLAEQRGTWARASRAPQCCMTAQLGYRVQLVARGEAWEGPEPWRVRHKQARELGLYTEAMGTLIRCVGSCTGSRWGGTGVASLDGQSAKEVTAVAQRPGLVPLAQREGPAQRGGGSRRARGRSPGDNAGRE